MSRRWPKHQSLFRCLHGSGYVAREVRGYRCDVSQPWPMAAWARRGITAPSVTSEPSYRRPAFRAWPGCTRSCAQSHSRRYRRIAVDTVVGRRAAWAYSAPSSNATPPRYRTGRPANTLVAHCAMVRRPGDDALLPGALGDASPQLSVLCSIVHESDLKTLDTVRSAIDTRSRFFRF